MKTIRDRLTKDDLDEVMLMFEKSGPAKYHMIKWSDTIQHKICKLFDIAMLNCMKMFRIEFEITDKKTQGIEPQSGVNYHGLIALIN